MGSLLATWRTTKWLDVAAGAAVSAVLWKAEALDGDSGTLLQVAGGLGVGLLAFVVAPVAILLSLSGGGRFKSFDRRQRPNILRAMAWAFIMSLVFMMICLVGAASVDGEGAAADPLRLLVVATGTASVQASARLFWFFYAALGVKQADDDAPLKSDQAS